MIVELNKLRTFEELLVAIREATARLIAGLGAPPLGVAVAVGP